MANNLPTFGASANIDSSIVENTSTLKDTGFKANTLIESAQVNTYMKMLINALNGAVNGLDNDITVDASSTAETWKSFVTAGIKGIEVTRATNVSAITNNDTASNLDVEFSIGDRSYSKTLKAFSNRKSYALSSQAVTISHVANTYPAALFQAKVYDINKGIYRFVNFGLVKFPEYDTTDDSMNKVYASCMIDGTVFWLELSAVLISHLVILYDFEAKIFMSDLRNGNFNVQVSNGTLYMASLNGGYIR